MSRSQEDLLGGFVGQKAVTSFIAARKRELAREAKEACATPRAVAKAYRELVKEMDLKRFNDRFSDASHTELLHDTLRWLGVPPGIVAETSPGKPRRRAPARARAPAPARAPARALVEIPQEAVPAIAALARAADTPVEIPAAAVPAVVAAVAAHPGVVSAAEVGALLDSGEMPVAAVEALATAVEQARPSRVDTAPKPSRVRAPPKKALATVHPADFPMGERPLHLSGRDFPQAAYKLERFRSDDPGLLVGTPFEARQGLWPYDKFRVDGPDRGVAPARKTIMREAKGMPLYYDPFAWWVEKWGASDSDVVDAILSWALDYADMPHLVAEPESRNIQALKEMDPKERKEMLQDLAFAWRGLLSLFHTRLIVKEVARSRREYVRDALDPVHAEPVAPVAVRPVEPAREPITDDDRLARWTAVADAVEKPLVDALRVNRINSKYDHRRDNAESAVHAAVDRALEAGVDLADAVTLVDVPQIVAEHAAAPQPVFINPAVVVRQPASRKMDVENIRLKSGVRLVDALASIPIPQPLPPPTAAELAAARSVISPYVVNDLRDKLGTLVSKLFKWRGRFGAMSKRDSADTHTIVEHVMPNAQQALENGVTLTEAINSVVPAIKQAYARVMQARG